MAIMDEWQPSSASQPRVLPPRPDGGRRHGQPSPRRLPWTSPPTRSTDWAGCVGGWATCAPRSATGSVPSPCCAKRGRDDEATIAALDLCIWYLTNLENEAAAGGWLARAARAAEHTTDPMVRGWLVLIGAYLCSDATARRAGLEEALRLAAEASDDGLHAMALADLGLLLVAGGEVEHGMALLDEAMATTLGGFGGRLEVVVWSSCNMLAACSLAQDLRRATQWCRVAEEFTQTYGCPFLQARCRAHYGSVLVAAGTWDLAEPELRRAISMSEDVGRQPLLEARTALAALRLRQGRLGEATELAEELDTNSPAAALVSAEVRLAAGRPDEAAALLRAALGLLHPDDPQSDPLAAALCEAYLAAGDIAGCRGGAGG